MRIVFLQSSLWLSGGAMVVIEHANRLVERGHLVSIVIPKDAIDPDLANQINSQVTFLQAVYPLIRPSNLWNKICQTLSMVAMIPKCDVIVATHTPTTLVSLLAGKVLRRGQPVWFYMDYPGMFEGRTQETWLLHHAMLWHRAALVLSKRSADELSTLSRSKIYYIGIGLSNYEEFHARPRRSGIDSKKRIMYLGDFRPRKGLADFLKAAEIVYPSMPDIELLLVLKEDGEVPTSVPHVKVLRPSVPELAQCYANSYLFVSASWSEGFGLPPLEAMACGTPVVLTDSGGVRDYAHSGENCLMTPPRDPEALSVAMLEVLSKPDLMERFVKNGSLTAAEFTWEKAVDRMEAALLDFLYRPSAQL